jgi:GDP/UDP-N,N'-diacetylbacillosamine 2-epimerase (hydrolysing)
VNVNKVAVFTATRAEFGLLFHTAKAIEEDAELELQLIVSGTHLSEKYGHTIDEIKGTGLPIAAELALDAENNGAVQTMATITEKLGRCLEELKPDALVILGDRYELLPVASVAVVMNIPIIHLCGGEITEGAIDEQVRHAITKMAHLHFAQHEAYCRNITKMGEESWRVHNVGFFCNESIDKLGLMQKEELAGSLGIHLNSPLALVTYHPVTLEDYPLEKQMDNLLMALDIFDMNVVMTYPNVDKGSKLIIQKIEEYSRKNPRLKVFKSLGQLRYLSLMKYADLMVGNSSSGILESPYFSLPAVNIGNRQKGRIRSSNIIDVDYEYEAICIGIKKALDKDFRDLQRQNGKNKIVKYPSQIIVDSLKNELSNPNLLIKRLVF